MSRRPFDVNEFQEAVEQRCLAVKALFTPIGRLFTLW